MKKLLQIILLLVMPFQVYAFGTANFYTVNYVRVDNSGLGYVSFTSSLVGTPASCTNGYTKELSFDTNTPGGKSILATVLTAKATGKTIYALGTATCAQYPNAMESWQWGYIQ
ncbi:hypothetical protein ACMYR3_05730 [Ampullimonas aquatilis]|uniref:hypothetical protein n=1 Tax=Ampullimonas aquatilis TaxID=1341549 RepID=UPI003C74CAAF